MITKNKYTGSEKMSDLISDNYFLVLVLSRFDIPLGFGDMTIKEVCQKHNIDSNTFISVINLLIFDDYQPSAAELNNISIETLIKYLKSSHNYFLNFRLASIRKKLDAALKKGEKDIHAVIIKYYDQYVGEVEKHMKYEEEVVFPYVDKLLLKKSTSKYNIDTFSKKHDKVESKLTELKNIIIKYYQSPINEELNEALYDIFSCAVDLASHNKIEDGLIVPAVRRIENCGK